MSKKNRKKKTHAPRPAAPAQKRPELFRLPRCPVCGHALSYREALARRPVFSAQCRCGHRFRCRPGAVSACFCAVVLLVCVLLVGLVIKRSTDMIPVFFFPAVLVAGAVFVYPFTIRVCRGKIKERETKDVRK